MMNHKIKFPDTYVHEHPPIKNINTLIEESKTFGQKTADLVAKVMGSWKFIIIQSVLLTGWVILNVIAWVNHWDPYPFILMNLVLSMQAAYAAPIIMMSQNRQNERDRLEAHHDYMINIKSEKEVRAILENLAVQNQALEKILETILNDQAKIEANNQ